MLCRPPRGNAPAALAPAGAQPHGKELVPLLGEGGACKPQQHPAGFDPFEDSCFLGWRIRTGIRKYQDGELPLEEIGRAPTADLCEWTQRPLEVVVLTEKRLPAGIRRGGDADRAAAPALVDKKHRARRLVAFDLDASRQVSELARHRQPHSNTLGARFERRFLASE